MEWRDIPGYEGLYQVSNRGEIRRIPRGNVRAPHRGTYYMVNLSKGGKTTWHLVHRLVAIAFIPNPNKFPCINHKDENKYNNNVENLEWCTYKYNANYGTGCARQTLAVRSSPNYMTTRKRVGQMNRRPVRQLSKDGEWIAEYPSLEEASRQTGVHISTIVRQCKGRVGNSPSRPIRKFKFEYINPK